MRPTTILGSALLTLVCLSPAAGTDEFPEADAILRALDKEMARSMTLQLEDFETPYQIQYTVTDNKTHRMTASYGAIVTANEGRARNFRSQIRVGSYELDNSNVGGGIGRRGGGGFGRGGGGGGVGTALPLDDDETALRKAIWLASDRDYKTAIELLSQKKRLIQERGDDERPDDFARVEPVQHFEPRADLKIDEKAWKDRLRHLSGKFLDHKHIVDSNVRLQAVDGRTYLVTSEGTRIVSGDTSVMLTIQASALTEEGETVSDDLAYLAEFPGEMPSDAEILADIETMAGGLARAIAAPRLDDYLGPILFDGEASPQLFQQLVARGAAAQPAAVGGGRRRRGGVQNLERFMNRKILPTAFSVYDDPRVEKVGDTPLAGHYLFDAEGVEAQRVDLIEKGRVQDLLMTRTPTADRSGSNGHARGAGGRAAIGCLFVEMDGGLSSAELKEELIEAARAQGLEYGIRVTSLEGGAGRNAQAALRRAARGRGGFGGGRGGGGAGGGGLGDPVFVYKVYVEDGREEPVRGAEFDSITLRDLGMLTAAGAEPTVLNRLGAAPSSIIAPAVLLEEAELIRAEAASVPKPILPAPHAREKEE